MASSNRHRTSPTIAANNDMGAYTIVREIGKGSFAVVYKGRKNETKEVVAIKAVLRARLNRKLLENLESEIQILKTLDHPHIVALLDCSKNSNYIHLVMEYCSLGDLAHFIRKRDKLANMTPTAGIARLYPSVAGGGLNEVVVRHFLQQLGSAIKFLHERRLIHRDVKPQNLLLNPSPDYDDSPEKIVNLAGFMGLASLPVLKLADFGFARFLPGTSMAETLCGSPLYMAPEILRYEKYDAKVDLWSAGAVAYEMLVGKPPFRAGNHVDLLRVIDQNNDVISFPEKVDQTAGEDLKALIRSLLKKNPVERLGFEGFFENSVVKGRIPNAEYGAATPPAGALPEIRPSLPKAAPVPVPQAHPQRETIRTAASAPAVQPVAQYIDQQEYDYSKGLPTLPIAESTLPIRPADVRRVSTTAATVPSKIDPAPEPKSKPSRLHLETNTRPSEPSERERELAVQEALSTPLTERAPISPSGLGLGLVRRDSQKRYQAAQQTFQAHANRHGQQLAGRGEDQLVEDYVVISKQKVEVNALADELAAFPSGRGQGMGVGVRRSGSSAGKEMVRRGTERREERRDQMVASPSSSSPRSLASPSLPKASPTSGVSALAKVMAAANTRLFGFGSTGASPPASSPFPLYPPTNFHTSSLLLSSPNPSSTALSRSPSTPSNSDDTTALLAIEDAANKSDIVYHLAEVKYDQIYKPAGDAVSSPGADELELTPEAIVQISEEALVLYVKVLSLLSKAMDIAGAWWAATLRKRGTGGGGVGERINVAVQWVRERFNESLGKAEYARGRLLEAQHLLPTSHPSHPSNHPLPPSTGMSSTGASSTLSPLPLSSSSPSTSSLSPDLQVYISPSVIAEKLIYERATGMTKWATVNELAGEDADMIRGSYMTAKKMLEVVLEGDEGNSGWRLSREERGWITGLIKNIDERISHILERIRLGQQLPLSAYGTSPTLHRSPSQRQNPQQSIQTHTNDSYITAPLHPQHQSQHPSPQLAQQQMQTVGAQGMQRQWSQGSARSVGSGRSGRVGGFREGSVGERERERAAREGEGREVWHTPVGSYR